MDWARPNPRVADAVARWSAAVEREGARVVSSRAREAVVGSLRSWNSESMPLDSRWIENDVSHLEGEDRSIARFAIVLAKAPYRVTDQMVADVMGEDDDEERFIRIVAWSSFTAARHFARIVGRGRRRPDHVLDQRGRIALLRAFAGARSKMRFDPDFRGARAP